MKAMRNCNDEIYQLAKDQALAKKLKNKRCRPFCHRHLFLVILFYLDTIYILQGTKPFICKKSRSSRFSRFFNSTDASMEEWPTSSETTIIYLQNDV